MPWRATSNTTGRGDYVQHTVGSRVLYKFVSWRGGSFSGTFGSENPMTDFTGRHDQDNFSLIMSQ